MNLLLNRTVSTHANLSIGTSIVMESIVRGTDKPYDDTVIAMNDCSKYQQMAFNVYTLCRNIISAVKSDELMAVTKSDLAAILLSEMKYIKHILDGAIASVLFYYCEYKDIQKLYPHARFVSDNTEKQKRNTNIIVGAISDVIAMQKDISNSDEEKIVVYKNNYEQNLDKGTLLFTNHPYNLLELKKNLNSSLIESHTARIKSKPLWYSKLHMASTLSWMPFNDFTIQVYGDSNLFMPMPSDMREYVTTIGNKFSWDTNTTKDRIRLNLSFDRTNLIRHKLLDLL